MNILKCRCCHKEVTADQVIKQQLEVINPRGFNVYVACSIEHKQWLMTQIKNGTGHYA